MSKKRTYLLQRPHGFNAGAIYSDIAPAVTVSSWQENNLIIEETDMTDYMIVGIAKGKTYDKTVDVTVIYRDMSQPNTELEVLVQLDYWYTPFKVMWQRLYDELTYVPNPRDAHTLLYQAVGSMAFVSDIEEVARENREFDLLPPEYQQPKTPAVIKPTAGFIPKELEGKKFRIRKLTPRECFRLMGVDDADIDRIQAAGISNSAQYKLAGNSIVVDVLYHIFRRMFIDNEQPDFDGKPTQLTLF